MSATICQEEVSEPARKVRIPFVKLIDLFSGHTRQPGFDGIHR